MTIVDASVMVAFLLSADVNSNAASAWMSAQLGSNAPMSAPSILIAEVGAAVRRVADQETGEKAIRLLMPPGFIHLEPVTAELAEAAALTAVAQGLKGCDAIYVELAIRTGQAREQLIRGGKVVQTYQPTT